VLFQLGRFPQAREHFETASKEFHAIDTAAAGMQLMTALPQLSYEKIGSKRLRTRLSVR
jgi:hypothetical protein